MTEIKKQVYGVEVEMVGIGNKKGAEVLAQLCGTTAYYVGGYYDKYCAKDNKGREWTFMNDGSLTGSACNNTEMVTPILGWDDIEFLQEVVRAMRNAGGRADSSCGVHVHVGADEHTPATLKNLLNLVYVRYDLLEKALKFTARKSWCAKTKQTFLEELNKHVPTTKNELATEWYGYREYENGKYVWKKANQYSTNSRMHDHYDGSRYQLVNLHSYFQGKGVEFRAFNGTVHAGEIKAYVQFCCALNAKAINVTKSSMKHEDQSVSEYWQMHGFLKRMGIKANDPEFKTLRHHMMKNLAH